MDTSTVFKAIDRLEEEYLKMWEDFCNIESPTNDKAAVDLAGAFITEASKKFGWTVERFPQPVSGDAICITMNADSENSPVCLSGHIDTVHPKGLFGYPPVKVDKENDRIYGPGVVDCKGGVIASLLCMAALSECHFTERPIKLILQTDEEVSSITSNKETVKFMADCARGCVAFLNCEGHRKGKIIIERKGIIHYILDITGKSAHSSRCYDGKSAILEAAHKIIELEKFKDKDGITCNCGVISGGTVANTVPECCRIIADFRYSKKDELDTIKRFAQEVASTSYIGGTSCSIRIKSQRASMEKTSENLALLERIREIFRKNGICDVVGAKSEGGSDAADMTSYGIPTVDNLGTSGGSIHSKDEWAYLSSLKHSARMLAAIISEI